MEWTLPEEVKNKYATLVKSAQDVEANIGSAEYRVHKLILLRKDVDEGLKVWWECVLKELSLDPKKDYMVTAQGAIQDVVRPGTYEPKPEDPIATFIEPANVSELK